MNRHATSRLAARGGIAQAEAVARADAGGSAVDRVVASHWRRLFAGLRPGPASYADNHRHALAVLADLAAAVHAATRGQLARLAVWSHRRAAADLMRTLPQRYLKIAMAGLTESRHVLEAGPGGVLDFLFGDDDAADSDPFLSPLDRARPLREPSLDLSADRQRELFAALLFPPPPRDLVDAILGRVLPTGDWLSVAGDGPTRQPAGTLANVIADGVAAGKSTAEVARDLRPYFEGSATRAKRAARTFGIHVSNEMQLQASAGLGDLVVGWQVGHRV